MTNQPHMHILGIGGTFMSAVALLARAQGYTVTGCDASCYPPISDLLQQNGILWKEGYEEDAQALQADIVVIGNAIKRGMPVLEAVLNARKPYLSGPEWIAKNVLVHYQTIAIAGTHGKTTTTSMVVHILETAGLQPGFLIGGVAANFHTNARLGKGSWFVIEADEYDSAFFDKRPKMMHYHPQVAVLNNLEFDHADIYPNLEAIQQQFHYYLKTIAQNGVVIKPRTDQALNTVVEKGLFSPLEEFSITQDNYSLTPPVILSTARDLLNNTSIDNTGWFAQLLDESGSTFAVYRGQQRLAEVHWNLLGQFNVENGLAAMIACSHAGVPPEVSAKALETFTPVKRRLEVKLQYQGITLYDDFAHHPTAIRRTIDALKKSGKHRRILVVLEFASNTMRSGVHAQHMPEALSSADHVFIKNPAQFDLEYLSKTCQSDCTILEDSNSIVEHVIQYAEPGDGIVIMSNRGFDNIQQSLAEALEHRAVTE